MLSEIFPYNHAKPRSCLKLPYSCHSCFCTYWKFKTLFCKRSTNELTSILRVSVVAILNWTILNKTTAVFNYNLLSKTDFGLIIDYHRELAQHVTLPLQLWLDNMLSVNLSSSLILIGWISKQPGSTSTHDSRYQFVANVKPARMVGDGWLAIKM